MLCLVRKSLILLFKKRLFKTLYTMYSTVHSKATVTGHQIVPADRQLKIAQLGVCWEAPSFQESLEPHVTEDTSSGTANAAGKSPENTKVPGKLQSARL